jgi:hypothetical protein
MTSIKPLQNPQRRNRELTMINVKRTFVPLGVMKNPFLFAVTVFAMKDLPFRRGGSVPTAPSIPPQHITVRAALNFFGPLGRKTLPLP